MHTAADLGALLDHLGAVDAVALSARLPAGVRRDVLAEGLPVGPEVRRAVVEWVVAHGAGEDRRALLGGPEPEAEADVLAALADVADPGLRTAVYLHPDASATLRRQMLAGGPGALPVPDELRTVLLGARSRQLLGPACGAADPELAAHAARVVRGPRRQPPPQAPDEVYAWLRGLFAAMPADFPGTFPELLATAAAATDTWPSTPTIRAGVPAWIP
ncbi:hypothetical protein [Embleya sp. AB8]|uniref:hypothetical protein n=1 Tax=Embleya sp. AB8 TaxID=3156304 RepID=UPI003C77E2C6